MKFGFVITNLAGGGAERAVLNIAGAVAERGHEVHLVLLERRIEYDVPANVFVHTLDRLSKGTIGKRVAAVRLRRLWRRLAQNPPFDLFISALPFANEIAILAKLPRLWCRVDNTLSGEIELLKANKPGKARRRLKRYQRLYGRRDLIAVSDGVVHDLHHALGLTQARIERIYNPFDIAAIRVRAREAVQIPDGPYVLHVGRFVPQKRHDVLLDAWAAVETSHRLFLLTNPDPGLSQMIEQRGLNDRVVVAGFQSNPYAWMAHADLLVLSSDHEGLPSVLIESLIVGTPVVSTDCPSGPREILGRALSDCLTPVADAGALARTIQRALTHRPDIARVNLTRFSVNDVVAAHERLARRERAL